MHMRIGCRNWFQVSKLGLPRSCDVVVFQVVTYKGMDLINFRQSMRLLEVAR